MRAEVPSLARSSVFTWVKINGAERQRMSFIEILKQRRTKVHAEAADPWRLRLERARGKVGDDGVERISTQTLFDILSVPQRSRGAGACRRLAKLMRELGWVHKGARNHARRVQGSGAWICQSTRIGRSCCSRALGCSLPAQVTT